MNCAAQIAEQGTDRDTKQPDRGSAQNVCHQSHRKQQHRKPKLDVVDQQERNYKHSGDQRVQYRFAES